MGRARRPLPLGNSCGCPLLLQADFFEKFRLCEKLDTVLSPVLKSYFGSLEMDVSDEEPSNCFALDNDEANLSRSLGLHQDAYLRNTQAVQEEHQVEFTDFEDFIHSKPPLNCLNFSFTDNSLILSY